MHPFGLAIVAAALLWPVSDATEGDGNDQNTVLQQIAATPVRSDGADAFRFSTEPQQGGIAIVVESARLGTGRHSVRVRRFVGHPRSSWRPAERWTFNVPDQEYLTVSSKIDQLLAAPPCVTEEECSWVCTDGPGILVERSLNGRSLWRRGSCGDNHPLDQIARLIELTIRRHVGSVATKGAFQ